MHDPDQQRHPQQYHLSPSERKRILERKHVENIPDTETEKIEEELNQQADRIQHLLDDTALLAYAGFLSDDYWEDGWEQLQELDSRTELWNEEPWVNDIHPIDIDNRDQAEVNVGFQFGQLVGLLY